MLISVDNTVFRINSAFFHQCRVSQEAINPRFLDLLHLLVLTRIFFDGRAEEEIRTFSAYARSRREFRVRADSCPNVVCLQAPSFRVMEGDGIGVLSADSRWIFPQSASDL